MHPLLNTTFAEPRPSCGSNWELPILTHIYPSVDAGVPPVSPQCSGACAQWSRGTATIYAHAIRGKDTPHCLGMQRVSAEKSTSAGATDHEIGRGAGRESR